MVRPSGDRVKTDRRDALFLSRLLAVGEFVEAPSWRRKAGGGACGDSNPRACARTREVTRRATQPSKFLAFVAARLAWRTVDVDEGHREWLCSIELADRVGGFVPEALSRRPGSARSGATASTPCTEFDSPLRTRKRATAVMRRDPLIRHGGGAENRTPVQSHPLAGVSKLSRHLGFECVARGDQRFAP